MTAPENYDIMTKKQIKRILRITFILASIGSLYFVPWILVKAWIVPLPDTVQEQLDEAIGYGFDGMIVYVDQSREATGVLCRRLARPKN